MTLARRVGSLLSVLACALVLQACGSGSGDSEARTTAPLAQARIDSASGGSLTIRDTGTALDGMRVSAPAGTFVEPSVTITVRLESALPAPLAAKAVAVGLIQASAVANLEATESGRFQRPLAVTMPYDSSKVGDGEFPVVAFYDDARGKYEFVPTTAVDRAARTVTFITDHFSLYSVFTIPGLWDALQGRAPFPPALRNLSAQGFTPDRDGFSVQNFSTYPADTGGDGICYGQAIYAPFYFEHHTLRGEIQLFEKYKSAHESLSQLDDRAREVSYAAFKQTEAVNRLGLFFDVPLGDDTYTAAMLITALAVYDLPQVVTLYQYRDYAIPGDAHTVVVYGWDSDQRSFWIYDPNQPHDPQWNPPPAAGRLYFGLENYFAPYDSKYFWIVYNQLAQIAAASQLSTVFDFGEALLAESVDGDPAVRRKFATVRVVSPAPMSDSAGSVSVQIDPNAGNTTFVLEWLPITAEDAYAHVYLNGAQPSTNPVNIGAGSPGIPRRFDVQVPQQTPAVRSLEVVVATEGRLDSDFRLPQRAVSEGYQGFLRVALVDHSCVSIEGPDWSVRGNLLSQVCDGSMKGTARWTTPSVDNLHAYFYQVGCSLYLGNPEQGYFMGTISGATISNSGVLLRDPEKTWPNISVDQNRYVLTGSVSPDLRRLEYRTSGYISGTIHGVPGRCNVVTSNEWYR